jgi:hypothetical protein
MRHAGEMMGGVLSSAAVFAVLKIKNAAVSSAVTSF